MEAVERLKLLREKIESNRLKLNQAIQSHNKPVERTLLAELANLNEDLIDCAADVLDARKLG